MPQAKSTPTSSLATLKIAIFFGGPSNERNISLDSARTFYDSVRNVVDENHIQLVFISPSLSFHSLDARWVYSNTIEDFEGLVADPMAKADVERVFAESDVLCPMVHGAFGEDGALTAQMQAAGRKAIVGSPEKGLALTLDKHQTTARLASMNFPTVSNLLVEQQNWEADRDAIRSQIKSQIVLDEAGRFIVKPNNCGSSDGVSLCRLEDLDAAMAKAFQHTDQVLVETRIQGREFSLIILQDEDGQVVPLMPTEVRLAKFTADGGEDIYTRSKKYLPGAGATHLTPIAEDEANILRIRDEAKTLFREFGLSDWARFDGFLGKDGTVYWSDLNGIPGSGLDSFLFQQAALFGLTHRDVFLLLLARAVGKEGGHLALPESATAPGNGQRIAVIGGGTTSERHVSRMSWFNVTQKLRALNQDIVTSIFLDQHDRFWEVPPFVALQHTVEEVEDIIYHPEHYRNGVALAKTCRSNAFYRFGESVDTLNFEPRQLDLKTIAKECEFAFLALHGGRGEDGRLQRELESLGLAYNGSDSKTSPICMDKVASNRRCRQLDIEGFEAPRQFTITLANLEQRLLALLDSASLETMYQAVQRGEHPWQGPLEPRFRAYAEVVGRWISRHQTALDSPHAIVLKPRGDGCSSGVLVSRDPAFQVPRYLLFAFAGLSKIPYRWLYPDFPDETMMLQMPTGDFESLLIEQFLGDPPGEKNFMEMTVGVVGPKGGMQALLPSETLAVGDVLSLDEKFNKGMGVNLTPPPKLDASQVASIRERVSQFANAFGLQNYARIDIMYHLPTDMVYLIEINTLPGLTAATILYTQALVTPEFQLKPGEFLDYLIRTARGRTPQPA